MELTTKVYGLGFRGSGKENGNSKGFRIEETERRPRKGQQILRV